MLLSIVIKQNLVHTRTGGKRESFCNYYVFSVNCVISINGNILCNQNFSSGEYDGINGPPRLITHQYRELINKFEEHGIKSIKKQNPASLGTDTYEYTLQLRSYGVALSKLNLFSTLASPLTDAIKIASGALDKYIKEQLSERQKIDSQYSLLHFFASDGNPAIEQNLKQDDISVNQQTSIGRTPLHEAAQAGHLATVKLLVEHGAGLDICDLFGNQARELAAKNGHEDVVEYLETTMQKAGMKIIKMDSSASDNMLRAQINVFEHVENLDI